VVAVTSLVLDKETLELEAGKTGGLTATISPSDATNLNVVWTSSDETVATVANGVVTAVAEGTATITATSAENAEIKDTCIVTVTPAVVAVESITLDQETLSLVLGTDSTITATVLPANASNKELTWESSDTDVVTVENGVVTAKALGTATITVTSVADSNIKVTCNVIVTSAEVAVTGISLDQASLSVEAGKTATIKATITPEEATNKAITWTSSNESVAKVENGVVTAVGEGTAIITATSAANGDIKDTCSVTVTPHVHTYGEPIWTWATNHSLATATFNCTAGDDTRTAIDNAPVATEVSAATCMDNKVMKYSAKVTFNGTEYSTETENITIPDTALGHDWGDWVVTKPATQTEEGVETRTCSRCKETETRPIPKKEVTPEPEPEQPTDKKEETKPDQPVNKQQPSAKEMAEAKVDKSLPVINPDKITTTASMSKKTMTIKLGKLNADNCLVEYRQASEKTWKSQWYGKGASELVITGMKKNGFYQYRFTTVKLVDGKWRKGQTSNTCYRWIKNIKTKKPVVGKKKFTFKWKKVKKAKGYEIQYATNKKFTKNAKKVTVKGGKKTSKTIKGLKKGKTYYVRIRPYSTKGGKKYLGIYTVAKKVKVK
jgi:uncharacterized protein YjdB